MGLGALLRLGYWLGPWAGTSRAPARVERVERTVPATGAGERPIALWQYRPSGRRPHGSIFIVPGLHFLGPRDPRLDRFARVLASAGVVVASPLLPDFAAMRVVPSLLTDTERAFEHFLATAEHDTCGVMSISFGSLPALALASQPRLAHRIHRLVIFGGFYDFASALHFSLSGDGQTPHDPLNRPALFLNLLPALHEGGHENELCRAWIDYMKRTWGRPEMKVRSMHEPIARELAGGLPMRVRDLFLQGCGVAPGGVALARKAIEDARPGFGWLDPKPRLQRLTCSLDIVHGRDDDVIPYRHGLELARAAPARLRCRARITGMYGHDGATGPGELVRRLPALASELSTMTSVLRTFERLGRG